jgi:SAM-dependent methyltransferase
MSEQPMDQDFKANLVLSYDNDAEARDARLLPDERNRLREQFVDLLAAEGRDRLVEFGAGAGQDAVELMAAGLEVVAMDLSPENVERCRARGIDAHVGDFYALDLPDDAFEAGWAMSTLLHVPDADIDRVLAEYARVLEPGAPLAIGLWGGGDWEGVFETDWTDPPRFFSWRSDARLQKLLGRHFTVEQFQTLMHREWDHYQWCILRPN